MLDERLAVRFADPCVDSSLRRVGRTVRYDDPFGRFALGQGSAMASELRLSDATARATVFATQIVAGFRPQAGRVGFGHDDSQPGPHVPIADGLAAAGP